MPEAAVIVDTGPLVAFLVKEDAHHAWVVEQFKVLPAPFKTCEAVLTETFFLVSRLPHGACRYCELLESGLVVTAFDLFGERTAVGELVRKYANVPMALADACLVRMAEKNQGSAVLTLDADFRIYRTRGRRQVPCIMPDDL